MEARVLKVFGFQIFAPTTKTFLRRFLRAAQASCKLHRLFFLPDGHWIRKTTHGISTLEHYTSYVTSDLKAAVLALQDLQLNLNGCPLNAIRIKYRQEKV
ncbi:hypothetical protein Tsubulata_048901 [Turnera subulata]|uniref:Cyclin C-terminal domain-containing protein n=1 Tax=Turnera subulata TaxID=218843 RepID=A0A9Q0JNG2_9ROSI|nr:hypothetical protein Tsubulata_048901 [Turnera subulata]